MSYQVTRYQTGSSLEFSGKLTPQNSIQKAWQKDMHITNMIDVKHHFSKSQMGMGLSLYDMIMSMGAKTDTIASDDQEYHWEVIPKMIDNYPLVEARVNGEVIDASSDKEIFGKNADEIELVFNHKWAEVGSMLLGHLNEDHRFIVQEIKQETASTVIFVVKMTGENFGYGILGEYLQPGIKFHREFRPVSAIDSNDGDGNIKRTAIRASNHISTFRSKEVITGALFNSEKASAILLDAYSEETMMRKEALLWYNQVQMDLGKKFIRDRDSVLNYSVSNRVRGVASQANGNDKFFVDKDPTSKQIMYMGSGIKEQIESVNVRHYNSGKFDIDEVGEFIMDLTAGRVAFKDRGCVGLLGEYGLNEASASMREQTGRALHEETINDITIQQIFGYKGKSKDGWESVKDVNDKILMGGLGQFVAYGFNNGNKIFLKVVHMKDELRRNKAKLPNGRPAESGSLEIYSTQQANHETNIHYIVQKSLEKPIEKYINGMRGFGDVDFASSPYDYSQIHILHACGAMVIDPTIACCYKPDALLRV